MFDPEESYQDIIYMKNKKIKEQKEYIERLEKENEELKEKNKELKAKASYFYQELCDAEAEGRIWY